jgi:hypothetical protein
MNLGRVYTEIVPLSSTFFHRTETGFAHVLWINLWIVWITFEKEPQKPESPFLFGNENFLSGRGSAALQELLYFPRKIEGNACKIAVPATASLPHTFF